VDLKKGWAIKKHPCITIVRHLTMHLPTCIAFPNSSLVFLANYAIPTSIIVKLDFATLSPCNTHIAFPKFSLVFWLTMQHLDMGLEMSIVVLTNYVIFVYLHVFPIQNSLICEYCMCHVQHVVFNIISMWVLHFQVEGPPKVNLD